MVLMFLTAGFDDFDRRFLFFEGCIINDRRFLCF